MFETWCIDALSETMFIGKIKAISTSGGGGSESISTVY
jgi:hypothetical protein